MMTKTTTTTDKTAAMIPEFVHLNRSARRSRRRGTVIVLTVVLMAAFFALVAFAIDLGYIVHARTELQRTADACALAAAAQLPHESAAIQAAELTAANNRGTVGPAAGLSDVVFGYWDRDAATFTSSPPYGIDVNAARVRLDRTEAAGNPLSLFFAHMIGTSTAGATASATGLYDRWLCGPFVGIESVTVEGDPLTDSYDSTEGPYDAFQSRGYGSVCSDGPAEVKGSATIKGDVRAGKGYEPVISGDPTITGSIGSRLKPLELPPVDASEAAVSNDNDHIPPIEQGNSSKPALDNQGNLRLNANKTLDLPGGTYYIADMTLGGQSVLNVLGPTTIFVTGDLTRAGGASVNTNSQIPADFRIFMTGGTANITSDSDFYGVIYAPNTDVRIQGSADLFGAVVGRTLTVTGSGAGHYDESLDLDEAEFPRRTALVD